MSRLNDLILEVRKKTCHECGRETTRKASEGYNVFCAKCNRAEIRREKMHSRTPECCGEVSLQDANKSYAWYQCSHCNREFRVSLKGKHK